MLSGLYHFRKRENVMEEGIRKEAPEDDSEALAKELKRAEKETKNALRFLIYLIAFLVIIWILFFNIIGLTHMPSEDMVPRIDAGDMLLFYRLDKKASFQDVIVFEKKIDGRKTLCVGRVMAAPGDVVDIDENHRLIVNGNAILEAEKYYAPIYKRDERVAYPLKLGEGEYFVLADNREQGVDSRYYGPVTKKEILGTVITMFRRNKI